MKRYLIFILIISSFINILTVRAEMADNAVTEVSGIAADKTYKAKTLIGELTGEDIVFDGAVTRKEFVVALVKIFSMAQTIPEKYFYDDVKSFNENAGYVYSAYDAGWIAKAESFNADSPILFDEAVKIAVTALGYGKVAERRGGFPGGYRAVAAENDILDGVEYSDVITDKNIYSLIYNILTTDVFDQTELSEEHSKYGVAGYNALEKIYKIYETEGIVNRTEFNSLDGNVVADGCIEINGVQYICAGQDHNMLGVNYTAFVKDDKLNMPEVVCMFENVKKSLNINLRDLDKKEGNKIFWTVSGRGRQYSAMLRDPAVIYNGQRVFSDIDRYFTNTTGDIRLVDNYGNGYDTVFINAYKFVCVHSMDTINDILRDKNSADYTLDLHDATFTVLGENGEKLDKFDIYQNDVIRVMISDNGEFAELRRIGKKITGTVTSADEDKFTVNGAEYYLTDYFAANYMSKVVFGKELSFYVTDSNEIVTMNISDSGMMYAYAIKAFYTEDEEKLKVKLYSQSGEMLILECAEKVYADNAPAADSSVIYDKFRSGGENKPQLIRYGITRDGKINSIDFSADVVPGSFSDEVNERDRLVCYGTKSGTYKSYNATVSRYFHINNSICFIVPEDVGNDNGYDVVGKSYFTNNTTYEMEYYDLDETGGAQAVVFRSKKSNRIADNILPVVIESVAKAVNEEDEIGYIIYYNTGTEFKSIFMNEDVEVSKFSSSGEVRRSMHSLLSGGDIIRFETNKRGEISKIDVEFDARKGVMGINKNSPNASRWNTDYTSNPQFHEGGIYTYDDTSVVISNVRQLDGTYVFSPADVRVLASGSNIVCFNVSDSQIRMITPEQVKTYKNDGVDGYYAVICQDAFITKLVVCYDGIAGEEE